MTSCVVCNAPSDRTEPRDADDLDRLGEHDALREEWGDEPDMCGPCFDQWKRPPEVVV